ncbi:hypothetical protein [Actinoplanes sp. NPDC051851]|uniref:hypothetical protein n=1 Tax=Actinoplanes sp. NPDC051851 TaxID=3154753 RepID=UPI0034357E81
MRTRPNRRIVAEVLLVLALAAVALLARWAGRHESTPDMAIFTAWYARVAEAGGWRGLGQPIGNYNAPFLYLLWCASLMPGPLIVKIKLVWTLFDVLLGFFAYRLVALRWGRRAGVHGAVVTVLLPTVVINASFYGQMDAVWASFALGGVYYLARERPWPGVVLCTVAFALKPQGIFVFPLVALLVLAGAMRLRPLLAAPAVWLALDLPAILLGRSPGELLGVYSPDRQASRVARLTSNAPSVFAYLPVTDRIGALRLLGYAFCAALVLGLCLLLVARRVRLDATRIVTAAAVFAILVPFTLPGMHERYFFLADVLTLMLAAYRPRLWYVPLLVQAASLLAYQPFLFGRTADTLDLRIPATLMLAALIATTYALVRDALDPEPATIPAGTAPTGTAPTGTAPTGTVPAGTEGCVEDAETPRSASQNSEARDGRA